MGYVPHTGADIKEMLQVIGAGSIDDLFRGIPAELKSSKIPVSKPISESELLQNIRNDLSLDIRIRASFLGAGRYRHYIPAVCKYLTGRSEFYTAYTPYQPEISQGTLTAIYEYQSMICELTGMDIANASMYDGASATAEAAVLAAAYTGRKEIVLANTFSPDYRKVIDTYAFPRGLSVLNGRDFSDKTAAVLFALPDFHGKIEDYRDLIEQAHATGALFIVAADPILLSVLESPGRLGADLATGEGQSLGNTQSFGGPGLGIFAAKKELLRYLPGRIVGKTIDAEGRDAYVLTMQTREQHIRREKATSNICSNQALCALTATIYLSVLGPEGLAKVAKLCKQRAEQAKRALGALEGFKLLSGKETYQEFVLECPEEVGVINKALLKDGIIGGYDLGGKRMLVCCTELTTAEQIKLLAEKLKKFAKVLA